jgi:hypothetical protein
VAGFGCPLTNLHFQVGVFSLPVLMGRNKT